MFLEPAHPQWLAVSVCAEKLFVVCYLSANKLVTIFVESFEDHAKPFGGAHSPILCTGLIAFGRKVVLFVPCHLKKCRFLFNTRQNFSPKPAGREIRFSPGAYGVKKIILSCRCTSFFSGLLRIGGPCTQFGASAEVRVRFELQIEALCHTAICQEEPWDW